MPKTKKQPTGDYDVGYCRPPQHTRWQKGQSGNPRGGPKRHRDVAAVLDRALKRTVELDGKKIPIFNIIIEQLVNKAARGELAAITKLFRVMAECGLKAQRDDKEGGLTFIIEG